MDKDIMAFLKGKEAVLYTRFSPRPKAETCDSCETQETTLREWCDRHGLKVAQVFNEPETSGGDEGEKARPHLYAAIGCLNANRFLVVYKWDRLARNAYLAEWVERAVKARRSRVIAVADAGNGEDATSKYLRQILAAGNEYMRKMNADRISFVMLQKQREGRRMGGKVKYGWRRCPTDGTRIEPEPAEQEVRALMLDFRRKSLGFRLIAAALNDGGMKGRGGRDWAVSDIQRMVKRAKRDGELDQKGGGE